MHFWQQQLPQVRIQKSWAVIKQGCHQQISHITGQSAREQAKHWDARSYRRAGICMKTLHHALPEQGRMFIAIHKDDAWRGGVRIEWVGHLNMEQSCTSFNSLWIKVWCTCLNKIREGITAVPLLNLESAQMPKRLYFHVSFKNFYFCHRNWLAHWVASRNKTKMFKETGILLSHSLTMDIN